MTDTLDDNQSKLILDGLTNAADSLAKAAFFAESEDPMKWKWLPLCIDHALYTAAIACLARDLRFVMQGAFGGWSRRPVPPQDLYYERDEPVIYDGKKLGGPRRIRWEKGCQKSKHAEDKLIGFWTALARVQDKHFYMAQYCITQPLVLSDEDLYWICVLHNDLRNPLVHYIPVMTEISIPQAAKACRVGAWAAAFLLCDTLSPTTMLLEQEQRQAITKETKKALYKRAGGRCECHMRVCKHHAAGRRCPHKLNAGYWEAHHRSRNGGDDLGNLVAMCATCHKNTRTFGQPK